MRFDTIYAVYKGDEKYIFDINDMDDYFHFGSISIYGIPEGTSEELTNHILIGNNDEAELIATFTGGLVLGKQMYDDDYDIYLACDDTDDELEFMMSALLDEGIVKQGKGKRVDIYYIFNYKIKPEYEQDEEVLDEIFENFKDMIFSILNVKPDIIVACPEPLEYEIDPFFAVKHDMAQIAYADIMNRHFAKKDPFEEDEGMHLTLDEDQMNYILGRRIAAETYPETAKDRKQWDFYEKVGFAEAGDTRVLYRR